MPRYTAFLRAINVGGHTVKMDRLRALFQELGFGDVRTFIASGNVLFDAPPEEPAALEARIERHLQSALGYEVATFLRTPAEVTAVAACQPFPGPDPVEVGEALSVLFLKTAPDEEVRQKLQALRTETDAFHVHGREVYWHCRTRISDSPAGTLLGKALNAPSTMRNITTVRKIAALV
jgi:uncharacterized protein (DUF1697 family)